MLNRRLWVKGMATSSNANSVASSTLTPDAGVLMGDMGTISLLGLCRSFVSGYFAQEAWFEHDFYDGFIDEKDSIYSQLRLWSDKNLNGLTEAGELLTLTSQGVRSIDLNYVEFILENGQYEEDQYGNQNRQRSVIELQSGEMRMIYDIWFKVLPGRYF